MGRKMNLTRLGIAIGLVSLLFWAIIMLTLLRKDPVSTTNDQPEETRKLALGFGEMGLPTVLGQNISKEVKEQVDDGWRLYGLNQYVSELVSVHRSLLPMKDLGCQKSSNLRQSSVVIAFHNEAWSVLLRTVHSIITRTPASLLKEIILVDDFSDMAHLKTLLEEYMDIYPLVKILRAPHSLGTAGARLLGAKQAEGPIITFLEADCEVTEGWLEPLLARVVKSPSTVVSPVVDRIDPNTLEYQALKQPLVGGFDWDLQYIEQPIPAREKIRQKHPGGAILTPTINGGSFTMDINFFKKLGIYDPEYEASDLDGLEISFKTWMCGGTIEIVPCSRVGHIDKDRVFNSRTRDNIDVIRNKMRLSQVWLDDYSKYYYQRIGNKLVDSEDTSSQKELRKTLNCQSFKWYLDRVYPELAIPEKIKEGAEPSKYSYAEEANKRIE